ncbi:hypothetical protein EDC02_5616 [Micromonospora sp. Llam0]|uniref:hypothetical protein n=1 Tax=Micromonospora sp. Llam0 TaxID=2485143 RepID=UPI000F492A13|nr:hypothetical protein [Micromonospora sp. Llam0]ROO50763.1 hypothetical protein EDC02_5616 [Micromonospora sp. Llam0]
MKRTVLRAATVLAAALAAVALAASGATASPSILQRFSVPSGDTCTYGYTQGQLEWRLAPPASAVRVTGVVVDRPFPTDPGAVCRDDSRYTIASYTAYAGERVVDETARRVDNGRVEIAFVLGADAYDRGIDRLVIQVCRVSLLDITPIPDYCGRPYTFTPSTVAPTAPL